MKLDTIMKINSNPLEKQFLREHSYWYKYLNRSDTFYQEFIKDMKEKYKLTTADKLNKLSNDMTILRTFLEVLK